MTTIRERDAEIHIDDADGTYLKFGPDTNRPNLARWEAHIEANPSLWRKRA